MFTRRALSLSLIHLLLLVQVLPLLAVAQNSDRDEEIDRAHSQGRSGAFADSQNDAHVDGCLRSPINRLAKSQTRRRMGTEADG